MFSLFVRLFLEPFGNVVQGNVLTVKVIGLNKHFYPSYNYYCETNHGKIDITGVKFDVDLFVDSSFGIGREILSDQ